MRTNGELGEAGSRHPQHKRRLRLLALLTTFPTLAMTLPGCSQRPAAETPSTFTMALSAAAGSLDSASLSSNAQPIYSLVNDPLERLGNGGKLTPALATSVSTPDPTTIVYHLRQNVHFSNGEPLRAADVVWSLKHDFAKDAPWGPLVSTIKSITATGPDEVTVSLTRFDPTARAYIGFAGFIYNAAQAQAHPKDFGTPSAPPVGTGPYVYTKWTGDDISLDRSASYWGPKPAINQFKFVVIPQDNTAQLAMRSGSIQGRIVTNPANIPQWKGLPKSTLYPLLPGLIYYLSLDVSRPPFNDLHVRRAIAQAVNRAGMADAIYHGEGAPAQSLVNDTAKISAVAPSTADAQQFLDSLPSYKFDLAKAKAELAESAYPHGLSVTLPYLSTDGGYKLTAQILQDNLRALGITVKLKPLPLDQFYSLAASGNLSFIVFNVAGAGTGDPSQIPGQYVGKENSGTRGPNSANYYPPAIEQALYRMTESSDKAARWQATQTILTGLSADLPYIPLFSGPQLFAVGDGFRASRSISKSDLANGELPFILH